jgi:hypothetical protein
LKFKEVVEKVVNDKDVSFQDPVPEILCTPLNVQYKLQGEKKLYAHTNSRTNDFIFIKTPAPHNAFSRNIISVLLQLTDIKPG